jgi:hypothetical protein
MLRGGKNKMKKIVITFFFSILLIASRGTLPNLYASPSPTPIPRAWWGTNTWTNQVTAFPQNGSRERPYSVYFRPHDSSPSLRYDEYAISFPSDFDPRKSYPVWIKFLPFYGSFTGIYHHSLAENYCDDNQVIFIGFAARSGSGAGGAGAEWLGDNNSGYSDVLYPGPMIRSDLKELMNELCYLFRVKYFSFTGASMGGYSAFRIAADIPRDRLGPVVASCPAIFIRDWIVGQELIEEKVRQGWFDDRLVILMQGVDDETVPISQSNRLYNGVPDRTWWNYHTIAGAGHEEFFMVWDGLTEDWGQVQSSVSSDPDMVWKMVKSWEETQPGVADTQLEPLYGWTIPVSPDQWYIPRDLVEYGLNQRAAPTPPPAYLIERVENREAALTSHRVFPSPAGSRPARGVPFIDTQTGLRVTRLTDVNDIVPIPGLNPGLPWPVDGNPAEGFTNGYSRWTNVNATGEYAIAFRTNAQSSLYRIADARYLGPLTPDADHAIGDTAEIRWDRSGDPGTATRFYYHYGTKFYQQDALLGYSSAEELFDFGTDIIATCDMDSSDDARYWAFRLNNNDCVVFDMESRGLLPGRINQATNGLDISPSGEWMVMVTEDPDPLLGFRFYRISDLAQSDTSQPVFLPTTSAGHNGWAYDHEGNEVLVYQDNTNDWYCAFNPEKQKLINIMHMSETGWGFGQHIGRITNPDKKGWALFSSYCADESIWSYNQIFLLEILPHERHPRIWRIASTYNRRWVNGIDTGGYFAEAFASIDHIGNNIYWGANWMGNDNLELYRVELPPDWHQVLNGPVRLPPVPDSGDFDGDGGSDIAIFRETTGLWAVRGITRIYFGSEGDIPLPGDYNGDGRADITIFRPSTGLWAVRTMSRFYFGGGDDLPLALDYDGNGTSVVGIFRPALGLWAIRGGTRCYFGKSGDWPVPGDYNSDGSMDITIFRHSVGLWSSRGISRRYFGATGDWPAAGDYDGDGSIDISIYRPSSGLWAVKDISRIYFGDSSARSVPADYDGDSHDDFGIFRSDSGLWAIRSTSRFYFGGTGDVPVTR